MKPRQAFGVAVRILGLMIALLGGYFLVCGVVLVFDPEYGLKPAPAAHYFILGMVDLLAGYGLMRGARRLVRLAYPEDTDE